VYAQKAIDRNYFKKCHLTFNRFGLATQTSLLSDMLETVKDLVVRTNFNQKPDLQ
jgi:hypothetical protein